MKYKYVIPFLLIVANVTSLYLIIDLSNYDELVSYLQNGVQSVQSPQQIAFVFFITCMANFLFVSAMVMKSIVFSGKQKKIIMRL